MYCISRTFILFHEYLLYFTNNISYFMNIHIISRKFIVFHEYLYYFTKKFRHTGTMILTVSYMILYWTKYSSLTKDLLRYPLMHQLINMAGSRYWRRLLLCLNDMKYYRTLILTASGTFSDLIQKLCFHHYWCTISLRRRLHLMAWEIPSYGLGLANINLDFPSTSFVYWSD